MRPSDRPPDQYISFDFAEDSSWPLPVHEVFPSPPPVHEIGVVNFSGNKIESLLSDLQGQATPPWRYDGFLETRLLAVVFFLGCFFLSSLCTD